MLTTLLKSSCPNISGACFFPLEGPFSHQAAGTTQTDCSRTTLLPCSCHSCRQLLSVYLELHTACVQSWYLPPTCRQSPHRLGTEAL